MRRIRIKTHRLGDDGMGGDFGLEVAAVVGQHVDLEEVDGAVAIDVGKVHRHVGIGGTAERRLGDEPEVSVAVVDPELVGILEVIGNVEVGRPIAVHIIEPRPIHEVKSGFSFCGNL